MLAGPLCIPALVVRGAPRGLPPPRRSRLEPTAVVDKVQKRYDGAADFRARFTQTLTSAAMGRKTSSAGR